MENALLIKEYLRMKGALSIIDRALNVLLGDVLGHSNVKEGDMTQIYGS